MDSDPTPVSNGPPQLEQIAVLRRTIGASLERIWENVLDWEHLPWLHQESFAHIELLDVGEWGWRARSQLSGEPRRSIVTELVIDREALRYVARTTEGTGQGSEIWTTLTPKGEHSTGIEVSFHVPNVDPGLRETLERAYLDLYTRLWDQDEEMMQVREAHLEENARLASEEGPDRVELGPIAELEAGLPLCVDTPRGRFRLLRLEGDLVAHSAICPHMLGPLEGSDAESVPAHEVRCPWHGHRFDVRSGERTNGQSGHLSPAPRVEVDEATGVAALRFDAR